MEFPNLPETLIGNVMNYLQLDERYLLYTVCASFWKRRDEFNCHLCYIKLTSIIDYNIFVSAEDGYSYPWNNIVEVDLGRYGTDRMLEGRLFFLPNLSKLSMVSSNEVSDSGLLELSERRKRHPQWALLEYIDITFCSKTTYAGTFPLRNAYPDCIIRRQPKWMDGQFMTPFQKDGEAHTYWCDGTFEFERDQQSCGYVCSLECWSNENHVRDKLQYTNFVPPSAWPDWSRFCYRPGVSLLRLENDDTTKENDDDRRRVLVGQNLYGIRPPKDYPKKEHTEIVPVNTSRYFSRNNELLEENVEEERKFVMVSCMKVLPLSNLMPPDHLVQKNREFCDELKAYEQTTLRELDHHEEFLHYILTNLAPT